MTDILIKLTRELDEIRRTSLFPADLARIIFCYSVQLGDLLLYMPLVYPGPRYVRPYIFAPISIWTLISININRETFSLLDSNMRFFAPLRDNNDPFGECLDEAEEYFSDGIELLMAQSSWFYSHLREVSNKCLVHFLAHV